MNRSQNHKRKERKAGDKMSEMLLSAVVQLKDKGMESGLLNLKKSSENLSKSLLKNDKDVEKLEKGFNIFGSTASKIGGLVAGAFSVVALTNFASESIEAYKASSLVGVKLQENMKVVKDYNGDIGTLSMAYDSLTSKASQLQSIGVVDDETITALSAQLSTFQLTNKEIEKLLPKMADMLVNSKGMNATQEDAFNLANQMGKAITTGSLAALVKSGVTVDENTKKTFEMADATERSVLLQKILAENVGNVNEEMAKTPEGAIRNIANAWDDMQEGIGKELVPVILQFSNILKEDMPQIQSLIMSVTQGFVSFAGVIVDNIGFIKFMAVTLGVLSATIMTVTGLQTAYTTAITLYNGALKVAEGIQWAFNIALNANPIGLMVMGAVALTAAMMWAYDNVDGFKNLVDSMTNWFKNSWLGKILGLSSEDSNIDLSVNKSGEDTAQTQAVNQSVAGVNAVNSSYAATTTNNAPTTNNKISNSFAVQSTIREEADVDKVVNKIVEKLEPNLGGAR